MLLRQDIEDEPVARVIDAAVDNLRELGAEVVAVEIDGPGGAARQLCRSQP